MPKSRTLTRYTRSPRRPRVGDKLSTWYSDQPDGLSTVLKVEPYTGRYTQWYKWVVRLTAPRTQRGWMETVL